MKKKIMSVFGTRPEAVKMAPLVLELDKNCEFFENIVCVTAQHREMLDQVLTSFNIVPQYDLNVMQQRQTLCGVTSRILEGLDTICTNVKPDLILVHGDPVTSFAAALTAFYHKIPVGHVEAGLRSGDKFSPFPEEMMRILTGNIAGLHFCPTQLNADNLFKSGLSNNVYVTGNTVIDALKFFVREDYEFKNKCLQNLDFSNKRTVFMTMHRRENLGEPLKNIFEAVKLLAFAYKNLQIIYAVHKNPAVSEPAHKILGGVENIFLTEPLELEDAHNLMAKSYFILTDSGGLQEEAPALGKPVLLCRTETERPEAVEAGTVKIAGISRENVFNLATELLENPKEYAKMAKSVNPYGDGNAAKKITEILRNYFGF